jgi:hypothetical protein
LAPFFYLLEIRQMIDLYYFAAFCLGGLCAGVSLAGW